MFRITEHLGGARVMLKLEGRLSASVITELDASWRAAKARAHQSSIWIDLTDVYVIDRAGEEQLARLHREGARFMTRGCFMRELVNEIVSTP